MNDQLHVQRIKNERIAKEKAAEERKLNLESRIKPALEAQNRNNIRIEYDTKTFKRPNTEKVVTLIIEDFSAYQPGRNKWNESTEKIDFVKDGEAETCDEVIKELKENEYDVKPLGVAGFAIKSTVSEIANIYLDILEKTSEHEKPKTPHVHKPVAKGGLADITKVVWYVPSLPVLHDHQIKVPTAFFINKRQASACASILKNLTGGGVKCSVVRTIIYPKGMENITYRVETNSKQWPHFLNILEKWHVTPVEINNDILTTGSRNINVGEAGGLHR